MIDKNMILICDDPSPCIQPNDFIKNRIYTAKELIQEAEPYDGIEFFKFDNNGYVFMDVEGGTIIAHFKEAKNW